MQDEMLALAGFRTMTLDPVIGLKVRSFDYTDGIRNATRQLTSTKSGQNIVSDKEIVNAFKDMMYSREKVAEKMIQQVKLSRLYIDNDRKLGQILVNSGNISKRDAVYLLRGEVPPWKMPSNFMLKQRKDLMVTLPKRDRKEAINELNHRIKVVRQLYFDYLADQRLKDSPIQIRRKAG